MEALQHLGVVDAGRGCHAGLVAQKFGLGCIQCFGTVARACDPFAQRFVQLALINGLGQVGIHARLFNGAAVFDAGLCGQRNHRQLLQMGQLAQRAGGVQPIHLRHVHVHQHGVEMVVLEHAERFGAIGGQAHLHAHEAEEVGGHLAVEGIVIDDEHIFAMQLGIELDRVAVNHLRWARGTGQCAPRDAAALRLQRFQNGIEQHGLCHRLDQQALQTQLLGPAHDLVTAVGSHHQHCRGGREMLFLADAARHLQPVHAGHAPVHQHQAIGRAYA